eukprot:3124461-Rhodomonas_salina.2
MSHIPLRPIITYAVLSWRTGLLCDAVLCGTELADGVQEWREDASQKAVVFSQFTSMVRLGPTKLS